MTRVVPRAANQGDQKAVVGPPRVKATVSKLTNAIHEFMSAKLKLKSDSTEKFRGNSAAWPWAWSCRVSRSTASTMDLGSDSCSESDMAVCDFAFAV